MTSKMVSCVVKCLYIGVAGFRALVYRTVSLQRIDEAGATRRTWDSCSVVLPGV